VCVCVCVWKVERKSFRELKRERENGIHSIPPYTPLMVLTSPDTGHTSGVLTATGNLDHALAGQFT
jgi:hypothetical protein